MILGDLGSNRSVSRISQILEETTATQMKIDSYCQRQRCNPLNVLVNIMFLALICCSFLC